MDRLIGRVADLVNDRTRTVTFLLIAIAVAAATGYTQGRDPWRSFLAEQKEEKKHRSVNVLREMKDEFDLQRTDCFLVVQGDDLLSRQSVAALRQMVSAVRSLDQVSTIFWIEDVPVLNVFGLADPLLPPAGASEQAYEQSRERLLDHPLISGQLISKDGKTMMLPIQIDWLSHRSDEDVNEAIVETADQAVESSAVDFEVAMTGDVPLFQDQMDAYRRNQRKFQIVGYILVFLLSAFLFRGVIPILIVGAAPMYAIFVTFGFMRWLGVSANPMTDAVLPVLLALMGVTDGVHLMLHLRLQRAAGKSSREAVRIALKEVGSACVMTSVTTAVGFGSLMTAHSAFVRDFGIACSIGVLVTLAAVLVVIPLLSLSPFGANIHRGLAKDVVYSNIGKLGSFVDWMIHHPKRVSLVGVALTVLFGVVGFNMRPDSRLASALPSASPAYQALAVADKELGGIELARIVIRWPEDIAWDDAQVLQATEEAQAIVQAEETLSNPLSLVNVLESLPTESLEPTQKMGMLDLLPTQLQDRFIQKESRRVLISFRAQDIGVGKYQEVFARIDEKLSDLELEHEGFEFDLTGDVVIRCRTIYQVVEDLARSLSAASLVIFGMIALAFRSWKYGLVSLLPNLFPLATTACLLVVLDRPLNVSTVCAFTVCLGMAVDDTIHFLNRYLRLREEGRPVEEALHVGFQQVGAALLMTTFVLLVGFSAVLTSELPSQRIFAAMACSTIGTALLGDMIFLPALLAWCDREKK